MPWSGRIPHAAGHLGPWATVAEPARLEPVLHNGRGRDGERPAHRDEGWPPLAATRESPSTETKTQHSNQSINKSLKKKKKSYQDFQFCLPLDYIYFSSVALLPHKSMPPASIQSLLTRLPSSFLGPLPRVSSQ